MLKTVFENEYVKALEVTLGANQQVPWHEGGPRIIYSKSDYSVRFVKSPDDTTTTMNEFSEGDVHWHDQNIHSVENSGSSTAEYMVFMRKSPTFPDDTETTTQGDVAEVESEFTNVLLENDAVKVINVELAPGDETPLHVGARRLVYSLSDYGVTFNKPDQSAENQDFAAGDIHWHEGGEHSVENTGDTTAEFLMVEFKK